MKLIFVSIFLLSSTAWSATDWLKTILRTTAPGTCSRVHVGKVGGDGHRREHSELLSALQAKLRDVDGDRFEERIRQAIQGMKGLLYATRAEELQIGVDNFHILKALLSTRFSPETLRNLRAASFESADGSARLSSQAWDQLARLKVDFANLSNIIDLLESRHIEFRDHHWNRQWVYNERGRESEQLWNEFTRVFAREDIHGPDDILQVQGTLEETNAARLYLTAYFDDKIPISSYLPFAVHCLYEYDRNHGTSVLTNSLATLFPKAISRLEEARQRSTKDYTPPQAVTLSMLTAELYFFAMDMKVGFDQVIAPFSDLYKKDQGPSIVLGMNLFLQRDRFSPSQIRQYFEEFKKRMPPDEASEAAEIFLLALVDAGTSDAIYRAEFVHHFSMARREFNSLLEVLARSFEIFNDLGFERRLTARWRLDRLERMLRRAKYDIFDPEEQHPELYLIEFRKAVIGLLGLPKDSSMLARKPASPSSS